MASIVIDTARLAQLERIAAAASKFAEQFPENGSAVSYQNIRMGEYRTSLLYNLRDALYVPTESR